MDTTDATISSVTGPSNGSYGLNQNLDFTVNFSEAVNKTGSPRLTLDIGGTTKYASYLSGDGTNAWVFRYTLESGLTDADGIGLTASVDLNGGAIKDVATNDKVFNIPIKVTHSEKEGVLAISFPQVDDEYEQIMSEEIIISISDLLAGITRKKESKKKDIDYRVHLDSKFDRFKGGDITIQIVKRFKDVFFLFNAKYNTDKKSWEVFPKNSNVAAVMGLKENDQIHFIDITLKWWDRFHMPTGIQSISYKSDNNAFKKALSEFYQMSRIGSDKKYYVN